MNPYENPYGSNSRNNFYINPYASSVGRGGSDDLTVDELLAIAQTQGGRVGQIATELSGGNKTMLSTVGKKFKNSFNTFIETISVPGQVVAGMISPEFTVKEAIEENKRVSDAIFGDSNIFSKDGDPTTMQKIGDFIVRLPTDILTDPLTYLTFGASRTVGLLGKMGFGSNSKVSVYKNAAEQLGIFIDDGDVVSRALSDYGQEILGYGKRYEESLRAGTKEIGLLTKEAKRDLLNKGINSEILDMVENNTKSLLKQTIDKPFDIDVSKRVISNIMEKSPSLAKEFIDNGGMKYFGKTILEGQRIGSLISVIPGVKKLDYATQPFRQSVQAMFDQGLVKTDVGYVRVPEEMLQMKSKLQSVMEKRGVDFVKNIDDIQKQFNLEKNELDILVTAINTTTLPSDPRLASAYYKMLGIKDSMIRQMNESGVNVAKLDNWVGLVTVPNDTKAFRGNTQFAKKFGAAQQAQNIAAIPLKTVEEIQAIPEVQDILLKLGNETNDLKTTSDDIIQEARKYKSAEEFVKSSDFKVEYARNKLKVAKDGQPISVTVYHGSPDARFAEEFNPNKKGYFKDAPDLLPDNKQWNELYGSTGGGFKTGKGVYDGISFTDDARVAKSYADKPAFDSQNSVPMVLERTVTLNKPKVIDVAKGEWNISLEKTIEQAKKDGYDGIIFKNIKDNYHPWTTKNPSNNVIVFSENQIKTKSQLEDIWKKAQKPSTTKYQDLVDNIKKSRSIEEVRDAIGRKRDELVQNLQASGKTLDEAINDKSVKELNDLQSTVAKMETSGKLVGLKETAKLKGLSDDVLEILGDDVDSINLLMDEDKNIYRRVATTAQELRNHGIEGFDENLLTAWTVRGLQNIRQGLGREFSEGLVRNFGRWADEAPESWVTMSSALVNDEAKNLARGFVRGDGVEMKFHPAVAKVFDDMVAGLGKQDDQIVGFLKGYDKLQSYYKSYLTTMFPMFHGRNAISNVLLNFLDLGIKSLDPARHGMAVDLIIKDRKINKLMTMAAGTGPEAQKAMEEIASINNTKVFTDRIGHEWTYGELRTAIRNNNIAFNPNLTGAIDVRNDRDELAKMFGIGETKKQKLAKSFNPLDADRFAPTKFGREVGRTIEEQSRLINFITNLIDTGDVSHATARTRQFLFDYQYGLTKFEKEVLRRIIPFYSFTRFNLELQAKMLLSGPGKIATEVKTIQSLSSFLGGETMSKEEKDLLPPWMANQLTIKRRKEDGTYEIISGFGTPIEQPFQQFTKSGLLGSISPIIKIPVEKLTGYDMFRGKMTSDVIDAKAFRDAPQPIKDFIGYVEYTGTRRDGTEYTAHVSLRPERMHSLMSTPYSRFVTTISSITDKDVSGGLRTLQGITGVRAYTYDELLLQQRKEDEMIRAMEKLLKDAGIRGQFIRGYNRTNTEIVEN